MLVVQEEVSTPSLLRNHSCLVLIMQVNDTLDAIKVAIHTRQQLLRIMISLTCNEKYPVRVTIYSLYNFGGCFTSQRGSFCKLNFKVFFKASLI